MDDVQFITNELAKFDKVIPYDDFTDLVTSVAHSYKISLEEATTLVHSLRGKKEVGSQEFNSHGIGKDRLWHGQDVAINFGSNQPGALSEPKSSLAYKIGDRVRVPASTWATAYTGIIEQINNDNTVDIRDDATGELNEAVASDSLGKPIAVGRNDIRDQRRRVGDPVGLMDGPLPVGAEEVRERTTPWAPKGQEGKEVKNHESLFYKDAAKKPIKEIYTPTLQSIVSYMMQGARGKFGHGQFNPEPFTHAELENFRTYIRTKGGSKFEKEQLAVEQRYHYIWYGTPGKRVDRMTGLPMDAVPAMAPEDRENVKQHILGTFLGEYQSQHKRLPSEFLPPRKGSWRTVNKDSKNSAAGLTGKVISVDPDTWKVKIEVTVFGQQVPVDVDIYHTTPATNPDPSTSEPTTPTRKYVYVKQELEELLGRFQPGHWHQMLQGVSPKGGKRDRMIRELADCVERYTYKLKATKNPYEQLRIKIEWPSSKEWESILDASASEVSTLFATVLERAQKILPVSVVRMPKPIAAPELKKEPEVTPEATPEPPPAEELSPEPAPQKSPSGFDRGPGRPSGAELWRRRNTLTKEQYDQVYSALSDKPEAQLVLELWQQSDLYNTVKLADMLGVDVKAVKESERLIMNKCQELFGLTKEACQLLFD